MTAAFPALPDDRRAALTRDRWLLSALNLYAQAAVGLSLYLYGSVSTPGYLSVFLSVPVPVLLVLLAERAAGMGPLPRALCLLPAAVCLMDAQLAFFALCAVLADVMPDLNLPLAAAAYTAALGAGLGGASPYALPRLARLMVFLLIPPALFCGACALGHGNASHFFPLLGYGPESILRGGVWMSGAAASACCPHLLPGSAKLPPRAALTPLLLALLMGALTAAVSAWLMPVYALSGQRTLGWRMLLVAHMTPSVPCWSLAVAGVLMLLLLSVCAGVRRAAAFLGGFFGKKSDPGWAAAALMLLLLPAGALQTAPIRDFLIQAAPWRTVLMAAAAAAPCLGRRHGQSGRKDAA